MEVSIQTRMSRIICETIILALIKEDALCHFYFSSSIVCYPLKCSQVEYHSSLKLLYVYGIYDSILSWRSIPTFAFKPRILAVQRPFLLIIFLMCTYSSELDMIKETDTGKHGKEEIFLLLLRDICMKGSFNEEDVFFIEC
jgi:hypothetical protein